MMRIGIASDHGAFALKQQVERSLESAGYHVTDFGAHEMNSTDDYPGFVIPLARVVAVGEVERGIALCGKGSVLPLLQTRFRVSAQGWSTMFSALTRA